MGLNLGTLRPVCVRHRVSVRARRLRDFVVACLRPVSLATSSLSFTWFFSTRAIKSSIDRMPAPALLLPPHRGP
jgi:hypothetical protein